MYSEGIKAHHNSIIIESQADQGTGSWHSGSGFIMMRSANTELQVWGEWIMADNVQMEQYGEWRGCQWAMSLITDIKYGAGDCDIGNMYQG